MLLKQMLDLLVILNEVVCIPLVGPSLTNPKGIKHKNSITINQEVTSHKYILEISQSSGFKSHANSYHPRPSSKSYFKPRSNTINANGASSLSMGYFFSQQ